MKIVPIDSSESIDSKLELLASEWTTTGEFWTVESCKETMRSHGKFLSAAVESHQKWLGWYLATPQDADYELLFIYCTPSARGQGVGKMLLLDLIKKARVQSSRIFLEVRPSNVPAIRLYEQLGFTKTSTRPRYYSNGEDAFVYQLST